MIFSKCLLNFSDVGFRFASYIDDYMVLQREPAGAVIWGYGAPRATVTVTLCRDQEPIMKKVTSVKGKLGQPLFSFVFFCHLLDDMKMNANSPAQVAHPSSIQVTWIFTMCTQDTKKNKTKSKLLSSKTSCINGNRHQAIQWLWSVLMGGGYEVSWDAGEKCLTQVGW